MTTVNSVETVSRATLASEVRTRAGRVYVGDSTHATGPNSLARPVSLLASLS